MRVVNIRLLTEFELDNMTMKNRVELLFCRTELIKCIAFLIHFSSH